MSELLADHPAVGRATERDGIRRIAMTPLPYLIFYRVTPEAVVVQFVRHAARDPAGPHDG